MYNDKGQVFMPFGSIMNAYGQLYGGSKKPVMEFLGDVSDIFDTSMELVKRNGSEAKPLTTHNTSYPTKFPMKAPKTEKNINPLLDLLGK